MIVHGRDPVTQSNPQTHLVKARGGLAGERVDGGGLIEVQAPVLGLAEELAGAVPCR